MIAMEEPGEDIPEAEAQTETAPEPMMTTMEETGEAVEAPDLTGVIIGRLFFSPEAWEINPSYRNPVLEDVVEYLKKNRSIHILISAHATPYESDSMELSKLRARSVESYLVSKGIENSRLTTRANGTRHPAATNLSPVGQAYNRRVDFIEKSKGSH
jgi:outer membrane protein OmpA-like peptidoglycan-associated protein